MVSEAGSAHVTSVLTGMRRLAPGRTSPQGHVLHPALAVHAVPRTAGEDSLSLLGSERVSCHTVGPDEVLLFARGTGPWIPGQAVVNSQGCRANLGWQDDELFRPVELNAVWKGRLVFH